LPDNCTICQRIALIHAGRHPGFVTELDASYVVLGDFHLWRGYTLVLSKQCLPELHDLLADRRARFLSEMALVAEAVWETFRPVKLNYEMLGNQVPHMHWHIFPRYADDPERSRPVWFRYNQASDDPQYRPPTHELEDMKNRLRVSIDRLQRG
jgi:diadenosine tetraphosphate (Ap4A) HIT family hydrolase